MSQKEDSFVPAVANNSPNARRNKIVRCPVCGAEMARKKLKKHKQNIHTSPQTKDPLEKTFKTSNQKSTIGKIKDELAKDVQQLKSVPLEYQASVYAKIEREKRAKQDIKIQEQLKTLKAIAKKLNEELKIAITPSVRLELERKISACDKAIKNTPKPRRRWSPILPGSFESSK